MDGNLGPVIFSQIGNRQLVDPMLKSNSLVV